MDWPAVGTRLGRYEIRSKVGEGGMGEVQYCVDNASILGSQAVMNYIPGSSAEGP